MTYCYGFVLGAISLRHNQREFTSRVNSFVDLVQKNPKYLLTLEKSNRKTLFRLSNVKQDINVVGCKNIGNREMD